MRSRILVASMALALLAGAGIAHATVTIVTTDTTLADLARRVGGDRVTVDSLSRGTDDLHHVTPMPSMVTRLRRAQIFARVGMDLDGWADALLDRCGKAEIQKGGVGYADCSANLKRLEIPEGNLDPSMGDLHILGNPHYLVDPANGVLAAGNIAAALIRVDPANQAHYRAQFTQLGEEVRAAFAGWQRSLKPFAGAPVVVYHRNWVYFMARFGLREYAPVEPKPGVQPGPGQVSDLVRRMKADHVRVILAESFRSHRVPDAIAQQTGARTVYVPTAVGAEPGIDTYTQLISAIVNRLAEALR